jgi:hypothetical protein
MAATVLYVLLHPAFLPASSSVAELGLEQVVPRHGFKPGVDAALFAFAYLVYGSAHVVVDAALGDAAQNRKGPGVGHFQTPAQATNDDVFAAPVKLEGFAEPKAQRYKPGVPGGVVQGLLEGAAVIKVDLGWSTVVAHDPDGLVIGFDGPPLSLAALPVGLNPKLQALGVSIDQPLGGHALGVTGLDPFLAQSASALRCFWRCAAAWLLHARTRSHVKPCVLIC